MPAQIRPPAVRRTDAERRPHRGRAAAGLFDRAAIAGRVNYLWSASARPARLDVELTAGELDVDALLQFGKSALAGLDLERPRQIALAFDIERARLAGFDARNAKARLTLDDDGIAIERLSVADFGNASIEASGRIATSPPGGNIALDLDARDLRGIIALAEQFAPALATPLQRLAGRQNSATLRVSVGLDNTGPGNVTGKLAVAGRIGAFGVDLSAGATGRPADFTWNDLNVSAMSGARIDAALQSDDGNALLALIGLDRMATPESRPARLSVVATGQLGSEIRIDGKLAASAIDLTGKGKLRLPDAGPATITREQLAGSIGGSPLRGKLAVTFADQPQIEAAIETDAVDAPAAIAAAIGVPPRRGGDQSAWPSEPFLPSTSSLRGRIEFKAQRATISPTLTARQLGGVLTFAPSQIVFEDLAAGWRAAGSTAGWRLRSLATASRRRPASHCTAPRPRRSRRPWSAQRQFTSPSHGRGLSPAALIGSTTGRATLRLRARGLPGPIGCSTQ